MVPVIEITKRINFQTNLIVSLETNSIVAVSSKMTSYSFVTLETQGQVEHTALWDTVILETVILCNINVKSMVVCYSEHNLGFETLCVCLCVPFYDCVKAIKEV